MKKLALLLLMSLTLIQGFALPAENVYVQKEENSYIDVSSNEYNSSVYLDGVYIGTTPLKHYKVTKGNHTLKVTKKHFSERTVNFYVSKNQVKTFFLDIEDISAAISFTSSVKDAVIEIDGETVHGGSVTVDEGSHTVIATKFGYYEYKETIYVNRRQNITVNIAMNPCPFEIRNFSGSRKKFNPQNKGRIGSIAFECYVTAPETGTLTISDDEGKVWYKKDMNFTTWVNSCSWDGSDEDGLIVYDGKYTATLSAGKEKRSVSFTVDSSLKFHSLNITSDGIGFGNLPLPLELPENSIVFGINSGVSIYAPWSDIDKIYYSVPFTASFAWDPTEHFELAMNLYGHIRDESVIGFNAAAKIQGKTPVGDKTTLNYGTTLRIGGSTNAVYAPFGADSGNGFAAGLMLGLNSNDIYFGVMSQFILKGVKTVSSKGTDRTFKNGIAIVKNGGTYELGAYGSIQMCYGEYDFFYINNDDEKVYVRGDMEENSRIYDAGVGFNTYIGTSSHTFNFKAGTIIYPDVISYAYFNAGFTFIF